MIQLIEANWPAFVIALAIGLLVAWWLFGRSSRGGRVRHHARDVLDEGAAPAQRNQALIDAPSAATVAVTPPPAAEIIGGIGEVVAMAASPDPIPAASPAADDGADDLRRIKGIGPKLVSLLATLGVTRFDQIAAWTGADIDRIDGQLGTFAGRIRRDSWVEQAKYLAAGDVAGFEAQFGKL